MKKIIGLFLLGYGLQAFSENFTSAFCSTLFIDLENNTHSTCVLIDKNSYNAHWGKVKDIYLIKEGEIKNFSMIIQNPMRGNAEVTLTYYCGDGMITIKTAKDPCIYNGAIFSGAVTPTILSIANMDVSYQISPGMAPDLYKLISFDVPGSLTWTFSNI